MVGMSDNARNCLMAIVVGIVLIVLVRSIADAVETRAYIDGGLCLKTERHDLPLEYSTGPPRWEWVDKWVKCDVVVKAERP